MIYPYTLCDYTRLLGGFPMVTHGYVDVPVYSAVRCANGANVYSDRQHIAWFPTMEEAAEFVSDKADEARPWWMRS